MSQFEFLRNVTIGQYLPGQSILHRLDPRAKLTITFLLVAALVFAPHLSGLAVGIFILLVGVRLARIPFRFALRGLLPPLPFIAFLALLQVLVFSGPSSSPVLFQAGWIKITLSGLGSGMALILRFAGLILALSLASFTIPTGEMIGGLRKILAPLALLKFPVDDLAMVAQISLAFLPLLAQNVERIAKAQAARGADWDNRSGSILQRIRRVAPILVPLFLNSLNRAERMALAMEARGYGSTALRSMPVEYHLHGRDSLLMTLAALSAILVVALPWG